MAGFVKGDVVVIPFPFSDLSGTKKRPALVLADLPGDDILLCQITSQNTKNQFALALTLSDFSTGSLPLASNIRPTRIFTADKNIIIRKSGTIKTAVMQKVINLLIDILKR
ncbi:MAG: type II toxin-antitoxin system PemK/MazF family toxin [Mucilaginibacter sp.]